MKVHKLGKVSVAVLCGAGLLYAIGCSPSTDMTKYRHGGLAKLRVPGTKNPPNPKAPQIDMGVEPAAAPAPDRAFTGPDGQPVKIADFKGKVVLVNIWATWCVPCRQEMPTLAALAKAYQGKPLEVVTLNADTPEDQDKAKAQIAALPPLKFYAAGGIDYAYAFTPPTSDFPTTVIYNKAGAEVARLPGDTDWNGKDARALVDALLK